MAEDDFIDAKLRDSGGITLYLNVLSWRHLLRTASRGTKSESVNDHRIELHCKFDPRNPKIQFYSDEPMECEIVIRSLEQFLSSPDDDIALKTVAERVSEKGQNAHGILCYYPSRPANPEFASQCWGYILYGNNSITHLISLLEPAEKRNINVSLTLARSAEGEKVEGFLELCPSDMRDKPRATHWQEPGPILIREACILIENKRLKQ